jgi:hypothetical protein
MNSNSHLAEGDRTAVSGNKWHRPADKLPPVMTEVPMWINGRHMVGYYNGFAWFSRRGRLPHPPMHWFERAADGMGRVIGSITSVEEDGDTMTIRATLPSLHSVPAKSSGPDGNDVSAPSVDHTKGGEDGQRKIEG